MLSMSFIITSLCTSDQVSDQQTTEGERAGSATPCTHSGHASLPGGQLSRRQSVRGGDITGLGPGGGRKFANTTMRILLFRVIGVPVTVNSE